jgi:transcriptional regulator with GAF, ATPase, and Fis domain
MAGPATVPALRERRDEILVLAAEFAAREQSCLNLSADSAEALLSGRQGFDYPLTMLSET